MGDGAVERQGEQMSGFGFGTRRSALGVVAVAALLATPAGGAAAGVGEPVGVRPGVGVVIGQDPVAEVMAAAGRWALERLPEGRVRLDPHRSGEGKDRSVVERVAGALGAELGTLEETRRCEDAMDPATCRLASTVLLAIAPPRIDGDSARVKVYAWYDSGSVRSPVAQQSWQLELRRSGSGWEVVSGG